MNKKLTYSIVAKTSLLISVAFVLIFICIHSVKASEPKQPSGDGKKVITSIMVEKGDSLWAIAERYHSSECGDIRTFVDEIRRTNGLVGDAIHHGNYLVVPYYQ